MEEAFQDIPKLSPFVDGVIVTAFRRWRRELCKRETLSEVAEVRRQLRDAHYDAVIDLQGLIRSAVVTSWANTRSYGYSRDVAREPMASFFYSEKFFHIIFNNILNLFLKFFIFKSNKI